MFFFFQAEDGIRDLTVTGVQTCALPISLRPAAAAAASANRIFCEIPILRKRAQNENENLGDNSRYARGMWIRPPRRMWRQEGGNCRAARGCSRGGPDRRARRSPHGCHPRPPCQI